jgi:hypothetical protein
VAPCHFREHRRKVGGAERKRCGNPQASAKLTGGQDHFPGGVDLGADPGGIVPECGPGFREGSSAGGSRQQLNAQLRFKPKKPAADDRLGNAEPDGGRRNSPGIGNFHECLQFLDVQFGVPHFATQLATEWYYRIEKWNSKIAARDVAAGACFPKTTPSQRQ